MGAMKSFELGNFNPFNLLPIKELLVTRFGVERKNKACRENTAAFFQTPLFPLFPDAILHPMVVSSSLAACYMLSPFSKATTGSTGDWDQSVVLAVLSLLLVSYSAALVWVFFTNCSPSGIVAPSESTLSLCSGYDFPLAFLLLSCLSFRFLLCWHGLLLFSSYCYSTVIFFLAFTALS